MRHYMTDPDNEERLLKIPPFVVAVIKAEAYTDAMSAIAAVEGGYSVPLEMPVGAFIAAMRREYLSVIDALKKERDD